MSGEDSAIEAPALVEGFGPDYDLATMKLAEATQMESGRHENQLPGRERRWRSKVSLLVGSTLQFVAPVAPSGSYPLGKSYAYLSSSEVTDGGILAGRYAEMNRVSTLFFPSVTTGYGKTPYGEFVVYASYVFRGGESFVPLLKPSVVNSDGGVAIGYNLVGDPEIDPIGIAFLFKQVRRCRACDLCPDFYVHGEFRHCKQCRLNGGLCACYCSKDCQRADWAVHKMACETPRLNARLQKELPLV